MRDASHAPARAICRRHWRPPRRAQGRPAALPWRSPPLLAPARALRFAHAPKEASTAPEQGSRVRYLLVLATAAARCLPTPLRARKSIHRWAAGPPPPSPHRPRPPPRRRFAPGDPIASSLFFPGSWVQSKDLSLRNLKLSGAGLQKWISNSKAILLNLVNCVENRRKIRKIQTQFWWIRCEKSYNFFYFCLN
jgi:hypothetical protein